MNNQTTPGESLGVVGWREWVSLPDLPISYVKAKVDTGAKSSSLHALNVEPFEHHSSLWVQFDVPYLQRNDRRLIHCKALLLDKRSVRSSSGVATERYVIQTSIRWKGRVWGIDLTLADRSEMGFRMLLGREAMVGRLLVDPSRSYCAGRPKRKRKK